jgi:metal-responsive CopG/Arc/MetJ family transcriptional regulator
VGKANISFPDGMLEEVDERAKAVGTTRSAFIQQATAQYLAKSEYEVEREARAARIEAAMEGMRRIGESLPPGPSGVEILRQMRDEVPSWLNDDGSGDE